MTDESTPDTIGRRVARARKRRGLTQHGLAGRASYSRSHVAQVEKGYKAVTPAFIAAAASALGVDPSELYGQPYRGETPADDAVHAPIPAIRRAMAFVDVAPDLDAPARPLPVLAEELEEAMRLRRESRHAQLGARLPALLEELTWHAYEEETLQAWRLLHRAQSSAASLSRRLGYGDLANMIQERSAMSALHAQDPHLPLMVTHRRALLMMSVAAWTPAVKLLDKAASKVDRDRADAVEVEGSLRLRAAIVSARGGDASTAWDRYQQAREVSRRAGGPSLDEHGTDFNPGNLAIHGAAIATELRDFDEAVHRDAGIGDRVLRGLAPERRAHHGIDMARVHMESGDAARALRRLLWAERAAPQMTRFHPMARASARHLADSRRDLTEDLRGLLARMRVA